MSRRGTGNFQESLDTISGGQWIKERGACLRRALITAPLKDSRVRGDSRLTWFSKRLDAIFDVHWVHEPTPNPSREGNFRRADDCLLPSWEGSGVGWLPENGSQWLISKADRAHRARCSEPDAAGTRHSLSSIGRRRGTRRGGFCHFRHNSETPANRAIRTIRCCICNTNLSNRFRWFMQSPLSLSACIGTMNSRRAVARPDSVLDCGSHLPLFLACTGWESARGLGNQNRSLIRALAGKQSKTWRHFAPVHGAHDDCAGRKQDSLTRNGNGSAQGSARTFGQSGEDD